MPGYRVHMVKVQQLEGVNDCGLFACAYITLLASGLDPSQYTFDQGSLRFAFRNFMLENFMLHGQLKSLPSRLTGVINGQINSQI